MGVAPEDQCHAFTGRQRFEGYPQPIGLRECGSYATDGGAVNLKPALSGAGFSLLGVISIEPGNRPIESGDVVDGAPNELKPAPKLRF